jgi:hypothetical protein
MTAAFYGDCVSRASSLLYSYNSPTLRTAEILIRTLKDHPRRRLPRFPNSDRKRIVAAIGPVLTTEGKRLR